MGNLLENKLGLTTLAELAKEEERISKKKALEMFSTGMLDTLEPGTVASLQTIHIGLFSEIHPFAGQIRQVNLAKGNFRFAPVLYLEAALTHVEKMPQDTFEEIVERSDRGNRQPRSVHERDRPQLLLRRICHLQNGRTVKHQIISSEIKRRQPS